MKTKENVKNPIEFDCGCDVIVELFPFNGILHIFAVFQISRFFLNKKIPLILHVFFNLLKK